MCRKEDGVKIRKHNSTIDALTVNSTDGCRIYLLKRSCESDTLCFYLLSQCDKKTGIHYKNNKTSILFLFYSISSFNQRSFFILCRNNCFCKF